MTESFCSLYNCNDLSNDRPCDVIEKPEPCNEVPRVIELNKIIDDFVDANDIGIAQGSAEWKAKRMRTIGGSEQATIEGKNSFSGLQPLILTKLGLKPFDKDIKMQWGNLFEDVLAEYINEIFDTDLKATEAWLRGRFPTQTYSPDGIAVVDMYYTEVNNVRTYISAVADKSVEVPIDAKHQHEIVLFEFKCPYNRIPDHHIAVYYEPQILAGMDTIRHTVAAIFTEGVFRRCHVKDLCNTNAYNLDLAKNIEKKSPFTNTPLMFGFILFKFNSSGFVGSSANNVRIISELHALGDDYRKNNYPIAKKPGDNYLDLGKLYEAHLRKFMNLFIDKIFVPISAPVIIPSKLEVIPDNAAMQQQIRQAIDKHTADGDIIYGVLPYKLMYVDYMYRDKIEGYLDPWKSTIDEVIGVIRQCESNPNDQWSIISKYLSGESPSRNLS